METPRTPNKLFRRKGVYWKRCSPATTQLQTRMSRFVSPLEYAAINLNTLQALQPMTSSPPGPQEAPPAQMLIPMQPLMEEWLARAFRIPCSLPHHQPVLLGRKATTAQPNHHTWGDSVLATSTAKQSSVRDVPLACPDYLRRVDSARGSRSSGVQAVRVISGAISGVERGAVRKVRRVENELENKSLKRARLVWTPGLHRKFVAAVEQLGEGAVPKSIMQVMGVEGLTRSNIASHLQKYRLQTKRRQGNCTGSLDCDSTKVAHTIKEKEPGSPDKRRSQTRHSVVFPKTSKICSTSPVILKKSRKQPNPERTVVLG